MTGSTSLRATFVAMLAFGFASRVALCDPPDAADPRVVFAAAIPPGYPKSKSLDVIQRWLWDENVRVATEAHRKATEGVIRQPGSCGGCICVGADPSVLPLAEWQSLVELSTQQLADPSAAARTEALQFALYLQQIAMSERCSGVLAPKLRSAVAALSSDSDADVRKLALQALGSFADVDRTDRGVVRIEMKAAIDALADKDSAARAAAVQALSSMTLHAVPESNAMGEFAPLAIERLLPLCEDSDRMTRLVAIQTLARVGTERVGPLMPKFKEWLGSEDRIKRAGVYMSVRNLGAGAAPLVPQLMENARQAGNPERMRAIMSLGRIGKEAACSVDLLTSIAFEKDQIAASTARLSLARLGPHAASAAPKLRQLAASCAEIAKECNWAAEVIEGVRKIDEPWNP